MRKKSISLIVVLTFLLSLFPMALPAFAAGADFQNSVKTGLIENQDDQSMGFIKIDDISTCDYVYVTVGLPEDVTYAAAPIAGTIGSYITGVDGTGAAATPQFITGDDEGFTAYFDYDDITDDGFIKVVFNVAGASEVDIDSGVDDKIMVDVVVKGVEDGIEAWSTQTQSLQVGEVSDPGVTITADDPKAITPGSGKEIAEITIKEDKPGALDIGDTITLELENDDDFEWTDPNPAGTISGDYGLAANYDVDADGNMVITITSDSDIFADELVFEDTANLTLKVFPGAPDGDVTVEAIGDLATGEFDDTSLVVATVGDSDVSVTVEDTADDDIFPGRYALEIDEITIETSGEFDDEDTVILELSEGVRWNSDGLEAAVEGCEGVDPIDGYIGTFDDGAGLWIEVEAVDEVVLEGLEIWTTGDAPVGDIKVAVSGTCGADAEVVVGTILAPVEATANAIRVETSALDQAGGDITIKELHKEGLIAGVAIDDPNHENDIAGDLWEDWLDGTELILALPTGVAWADDPTVEVNGDEVDVQVQGEDDEYLCISNMDLSNNKIDEIVISDITYDLDMRARSADVKVSIYGPAINDLGNDNAANVIDGNDEEDEFDVPVASVVVAKAMDQGANSAVFTLGSTSFTLNGETQTMDVAPYAKNGRTYLPIRYVAKVLGIKESGILWKNGTATFIKGDKVVSVTIGSKTMMINGTAVAIDAAPEIVSGRTMLPIRWIGVAFGAELIWDDVAKTVTIN